MTDKKSPPLSFWASLPERTLRALVGVAGGAAMLLIDTVLPEVILDTTLYRILIGDGLRFAVERFAGVEQESPLGQGQPPVDDFHIRKMVGTAVEGAGLLAVHFSPLWVFAIAGDAAAGSKVFLERLVAHLKEYNVLPQDAQILDLTELLDALQAASRQTARLVDTPPLSRRELAIIAGDLQHQYRKVFTGSSELILGQFETLWERMQRISRKEGISIAEVGGLMALQLARGSERRHRMLSAFRKTSRSLLDEKILDRYTHILDEIHAEGIETYVRRRMKPYMHAAARQFDPQKESWIERTIKRLKSDSHQDG